MNQKSNERQAGFNPLGPFPSAGVFFAAFFSALLLLTPVSLAVSPSTSAPVPTPLKNRSAVSARVASTKPATKQKAKPRKKRARAKSTQDPNQLYVNLQAAVAIDNETGQVVYSKNADSVRPIASISKLLTVITLLDMNFNRDTVIEVTKEDVRQSSKSPLREGDQVRSYDLFLAALIGSDNRASRALARTFGGSIGAFAALMNITAESLGLTQTYMVEPTGLSEQNRSSATDVARLINAAARYDDISVASRTPKHEFAVTTKKKKIRSRHVVNTNRLLRSSKYHVLAGKTGFISESGWCLTTILENDQGKKLTLVALGARGQASRFRETLKMANYAFKKI